MTSFRKPPTKLSLVVLIVTFCVIGLAHFSAPYDGGISLLVSALVNTDSENFEQIIVHLSYFPRLAMALLVGAAMGLAGCTMQFVLRNPIAAPTTLGVAAGAELGLILGVLLLPSSFLFLPTLSAFFGACVATTVVFSLASRSGFAPVQMVLAGMVVSLFLSSINVILVMINEYQLQSVFVWGTGALNQGGWDSFLSLVPIVLLPAIALMLMQKSLSMLQLGDELAQSAGVNVKRIRILSLGLAIFVTAGVVAEVGLIGFVGIVAPAIARLLGARTLKAQLLSSIICGALLLLCADMIVQIVSGFDGEDLPTGAMTALIGAPFFLWLLTRHRWQSDLRANYQNQKTYRVKKLSPILILLTLLTISAVFVSLFVGKSAQGWTLSYDPAIFDLRFPRVIAALFAGIGLAFAGTMLQRMTNNPMASPEVLGISSGVSFAVVVATILGVTVTQSMKFTYGIIGAVSVLGLLWFMGQRKQFLASQLLLAGIAISAALSAGVAIALSEGGESILMLVNWLAGSLYLVTYDDILVLGISISVLSLLVFASHRQLDIVFLGDDVARSLGLNVTKIKGIFLLCIGALTTCCMIIIGPLSFVGLIAPHMARSFHQYTAGKQLIIAALLGALIMIVADWVGRTIWFPQQYPAGLLASLIGGAYFIFMLRRQ